MESILTAVAVGVLLYFFVVAALVMSTVRMVAGFWPRFSKALLCSMVIFVLSLIVTSVVQSVVGAGNGFAPSAGIMLVLNAVVVNGLIKRPDGTSIGLVLAGLASLVQMVFEIALLVLFVLSLGLSFFAAMLGRY
jgi:hypothetical protein